MLHRRAFLKHGVGAAIASSGPFVHVRRRPKLRVLGTHVTLKEQIRRRAERDLDIDIEFMPGGSAAVVQQASTRPHTFDIYEQWSNSIRVLWGADAIQPVDTDRVELWSEINPLSKSGRLTPDARPGLGDAPYRILHVQEDGSLGETPTGRVSFLPYVHNVDSFGYLTDVVPEGAPYEEESWGWLLDERWRGRVALVNEPTIGIFDAALAVEAAGLMTFDNIGAMTRREVDDLFDILVEYKRSGHFNGMWSSVPQSIEFMEQGRVVIESMFSPAVSTLNGRGFPVHYAAPREGYRAWHGVMCLSSQAEGEVLDAAYRFMNWWLSGWAGAFIARQGYYISVPQRTREFLSAEEWDYWYEGLPASADLRGTDGKVSVAKGARRRGGSYQNRFSNISVWNTVMDTYEYSMLRWYEFLSA